ncbi:hypothetical protein RJ55_04420 [Drechmeria coniospora]|nr:hypothetical protein RJ55_04420 [Drechmeria coniospora]
MHNNAGKRPRRSRRADADGCCRYDVDRRIRMGLRRPLATAPPGFPSQRDSGRHRGPGREAASSAGEYRHRYAIAYFMYMGVQAQAGAWIATSARHQHQHQHQHRRLHSVIMVWGARRRPYCTGGAVAKACARYGYEQAVRRTRTEHSEHVSHANVRARHENEAFACRHRQATKNVDSTTEHAQGHPRRLSVISAHLAGLPTARRRLAVGTGRACLVGRREFVSTDTGTEIIKRIILYIHARTGKDCK